MTMHVVGFVHAQFSYVVDTWNSPSYTTVNAIAGNAKSHVHYIPIDVEQSGSDTCYHKDLRRRIEVCIQHYCK